MSDIRLLNLQVRLLVPVFSATDQMGAGTVGRVRSIYTYPNYKQAVDLETADGIRISEIAIGKVEAT